MAQVTIQNYGGVRPLSQAVSGKVEFSAAGDEYVDLGFKPTAIIGYVDANDGTDKFVFGGELMKLGMTPAAVVIYSGAVLTMTTSTALVPIDEGSDHGAGIKLAGFQSGDIVYFTAFR